MVDQPIRGSLLRQDRHIHALTYDPTVWEVETGQAFPDLRKLNLWDFRFMQRQKKKMPLFFLNICHIFPCRNESSKTKLVEYCWVITQVVGHLCWGWSGSTVLEFGFHLDSNVYTFRTGDQMYTQFQFVQNLVLRAIFRNATTTSVGECLYMS